MNYVAQTCTPPKRIFICGRILEFPAGIVEPNEQPQPAMEREPHDEAGYSTSQWDSLGVLLPHLGYSFKVIHLFLARQLTSVLAPLAGDDDEDIEVVQMQLQEIGSVLAM